LCSERPHGRLSPPTRRRIWQTHDIAVLRWH
jgi:hypothetical protein